MPNPNYRKGTRAERIVKAQLETMGHHVIRRYASKGPYDLLALPRLGRPLMVEVKTGSGRMSPAERDTLYWLAQDHRAEPIHAHYAQGVTTWSFMDWDEATGHAEFRPLPIESGAYRDE